jgi:thiamine-monophosphate kinase
MPSPRPGEFEVIARHFAPLARDGRVAALGLLDDAATLRQEPGHDLVLTADALVAGVHFFADDPPDLVARKALRVNLSDLAAKGARPIAYLLCLALPPGISEDWIAGFARGLALDQAEFALALAGGDTTSTPGPLTIAVTAIGEVMAGRMLQRRGGAVGDDVWVSGTVGDAALGLRMQQAAESAPLSGAERDWLLRRYRLPDPRCALGAALAPLGVVAMDVSDGLIQDLGHITQLAGCGAVLDPAAIPFSTAARNWIARDERLLDVALGGGDDYEILAVAPPRLAARIQDAARAAATPITRIGTLVPGSFVGLGRAGEGEPRRLARGGWTHF